MEEFPGIEVAFKLTVPTPFLTRNSPIVIGLKPFTYDSIRGERSLSAPNKGGSWASVIVAMILASSRLSSSSVPTSSGLQV